MQLKKLIDQHVAYYQAEEEDGFRRARRYYQGQFYRTWREDLRASNPVLYTSLNMVYAITETAVTSLVGSNPTVSATPRRWEDVGKSAAAADAVNQIWDLRKIRREMTLAVVDSTLLGRGVIKTTWDQECGLPTIRAQDPATVFFDLEARTPEDITYWLQATVLTQDEIKQRQRDKIYRRSKKPLRNDAYPGWMQRDSRTSSQDALRKLQKWVVVYEYYDLANKRVQHYVPSSDVMLLDEELDYVPFSLLQANSNGVDCRGVSEVQLILPQQMDLNDALSQQKRIVMTQRPKVGYDASEIDEQTVGEGQAAETASVVGYRRVGHTTGHKPSLAECFFTPPSATVPPDLHNFVEQTQSTISVVSALAESARGQVTGAQTATEMALIDAQSRTRLASREANLYECFADVADKTLYLWASYGKDDLLIERKGGEFAKLEPKSLRDVQAVFEVSLYNPIRSNPLVEAEAYNAVYETLLADDSYDSRLVREEFLRVNNLSPELLKEPEDEPEGQGPLTPEQTQEAALLEGMLAEQAMAPTAEAPQDPATIQAAALDEAATPTGAANMFPEGGY